MKSARDIIFSEDPISFPALSEQDIDRYLKDILKSIAALQKTAYALGHISFKPATFSFKGKELNRVKMDGLHLKNSDFSESYLLFTSFANSIKDLSSLLDNTSFKDSKIKYGGFDLVFFSGCNFENAEVANTSFEYATIENSSFKGARFESSKFQDARFTGCDFSNSSFVYSDFLKTQLGKGNIFFNSNFTGTAFGAFSQEAKIADLLFEESNFKRASFLNTKMKNISFLKTDLAESIIQKSHLGPDVFIEESDCSEIKIQNVFVVESTFQKASFERAFVKNTTFSVSSFKDVDFSKTSFWNVRFENCHFENVSFPKGQDVKFSKCSGDYAP